MTKLCSVLVQNMFGNYNMSLHITLKTLNKFHGPMIETAALVLVLWKLGFKTKQRLASNHKLSY